MSNDQGYAGNNQHPAYQLARDVIAVVQILVLAYLTTIGQRNSDKIEQVEQKQEVAATKQDQAAVKTEAVKTTLEETRKEDNGTQGVVLYSTWRYLEDVAEASRRAQDKAKAVEAKKVYDAHLKRHAPKVD